MRKVRQKHDQRDMSVFQAGQEKNINEYPAGLIESKSPASVRV